MQKSLIYSLKELCPSVIFSLEICLPYKLQTLADIFTKFSTIQKHGPASAVHSIIRKVTPSKFR